jgi:transposase
VSEVSVERLRAANAQLRDVVAAKDAQIAALKAVTARQGSQIEALEAGGARQRSQIEALQAVVAAQGLQIAELRRRLGMGSDDSGTPSSKESIQARARRKAERRERARDVSSRERSPERRRGGQTGHEGHGLTRDPDPDKVEPVDPPTRCRGCGAGLAGAAEAGTGWSQTWDVEIIRRRVEYLLPRRRCACGLTTTACPPQGQAGAVCYGPRLNAAAIVLSAYGNVPTERAATVIEMLFGVDVSAGFVDRANARLSQRLEAAGFDAAMLTALLGEPTLGADESPVEVVRPGVDPDGGQPAGGAAHVMVIRTPDERLVWLYPLASRRHEDVIAHLTGFTGYLIVDGYGAYQKLLDKLAGIQQCVQHVFRRCRAVAKLGPGGVQTWATKVRAILAEAHDAVTAAKADGRQHLDPDLLADLRARYDHAVAAGIIHNRHRDWDGDGNHPGYALATWLTAYADQIWLFTRAFDVDWTNNASERGVKPAKRHQAVSGYWQTHQTLARWCRNASYLTSARNHGLTVLDAIHTALDGHPWLPVPAPG